MSAPRILLVDDDTDLLKLLSIRLESENYDVDTAESGEEALSHVMKSRPDVVVTDLKMGGMDGMELLTTLHREASTIPVIIMTAHGTIPDAVEATKRGAFSFVTKPVEKDQLLAELEKALGTYRKAGSEASADSHAEIITRNSTMQDLIAKASRAASSQIPVLLSGESGTGKELFARHIHNMSGRSGKFVPVNCGAIPESLLESELFGHLRGAFTGADKAREGLIKLADEGTLFLDEIGDMPMPLQAKLLRALQEGKIRPLGASDEISVDIQVVSATHRNLKKAVEDGNFREDLFYRLNVLPLAVPPLRDRLEDIPLLADYFLEEIARESGQEQHVFAPEAMELLISASWPGNVRQLHNLVQQTVALATGPVITSTQVADALGESGSLMSFDEARDEFTRQYLIQLLKMTGGNVSRAAKLAERNRTDFHKLLKRHDIEASTF
ncbi:MAG: sigma 54-interacting transcriptional regulator [Pseudomonadales bacterium]|nr:sigma 54-interacting transcriptional regulator [Pseudomonadales bacterium]